MLLLLLLLLWLILNEHGSRFHFSLHFSYREQWRNVMLYQTILHVHGKCVCSALFFSSFHSISFHARNARVYVVHAYNHSIRLLYHLYISLSEHSSETAKHHYICIYLHAEENTTHSIHSFDMDYIKCANNNNNKKPREKNCHSVITINLH